MGGLSKVDCTPQCRWASFDLLRAQIEQKAEGGIHPFFPASLIELKHIILSSLTLRLGFKSLVPWFSRVHT